MKQKILFFLVASSLLAQSAAVAYAAPMYDVSVGTPRSEGALGLRVDSFSHNCEMVSSTMVHCILDVVITRTSNFWGATSAIIRVPVSGVPDGPAYWYKPDNLHDNENLKIGFEFSAGCVPVPDPIGTCIVNTSSDMGNIYLTVAPPLLAVPGVPEQHTYKFEFWWSIDPVNVCEDQYILITEDTYEIDPTIEMPLGPEGDPPDDQIYTTEEGQIYRIQVSGEWDDGTDTRDDTAVSWDGETWVPLVELPNECSAQNEDGDVKIFYVIAQSETFYIRANDVEDEFADNEQGEDPLTYSIGLTEPVENNPLCESQYVYTPFEDIVGFTGVDGNDGDGALLNNIDDLIVGEWYVVAYAYGDWQDEGSQPDRTDIEYSYNRSSWFDLAEGSGTVWCVSSSGVEILIQAQGESFYIRVNDEIGGFANNTGTVYYDIYHATFIRTPNDCEVQYVIGSLRETKTVDATMQGGKHFAFMTTNVFGNPYGQVEHGQWYVLDTVDGPWKETYFSDDNPWRYDMAVSMDDGVTWEPLENWSYPACNFATDTLGHRRVIFQMPFSGPTEWKLRVNDTGIFIDNRGSMTWNLYNVTKLSAEPGVGNGQCDYSYDEFSPVAAGRIPAKTEQGVSITGLSPGTLYVLKVIGSDDLGWWEHFPTGPDMWETVLYDTQLSHDGGATFHNLPDNYPSALCSHWVDNDLFVFLQPGENFNYRIRVGPSDSYSNNVGEMQYIVYPATPGQTVVNTCMGGWARQILNESEIIKVRDEMGNKISAATARYDEFVNLVPGRMYYIETPANFGPWKSEAGGSNRWDTALSRDNGVTWQPLDFDNTDIECAGRMLVGNVWYARFLVEEGDVWRIRVNDSQGAFADNGGSMAYKLYAVCEHPCGIVSLPNDSQGTDGIPAITIQGGGNVCTIPVMRPGPLTISELVNLGTYLGNWIQYINLSVLRFMAWCPQHTKLVTTHFSTDILNKEPFATFKELNDLMLGVRREMESYSWASRRGYDSSIFTMSNPNEVRQLMRDLFQIDGGSNRARQFWEGNLNVEFNDTGFPASYSQCDQVFQNYLPQKMKSSMCFIQAWFIETSASLWLQLIVDIGAIMIFVGGIKGAAQEVIYMLTGVKPWTKSNPSVTVVNQTDASIGGSAFRIGGRLVKNRDGTYSVREDR